MNNYKQDIKSRLNEEEKYRSLLFRRSYLLTDAEIKDVESYPFYGLWKYRKYGNYSLFSHPLLGVYDYKRDDRVFILIGHAYNPYTSVIDENVILTSLAQAYSENETVFFNKVDELTGVFVLLVLNKSGEITALQDCGGQRLLYFGKVKDSVVFSSSPQLVADLFDLQPDFEIEHLLASKGYYRGSGFLPGNKSPYSELKRLGPNTLVEYNCVSFSIRRFFPREQIVMLKSDEEKKKKITEMQRLFSTNIGLAIKKWDRVALSLTGGMDSKTTFANAKEWYKDLFIYSFASKNSEIVDADAAADICRRIGVKHHFYEIPETNVEVEDYDFLKKIIEQNTSNICKLHPNEIRKYIFFQNLDDFDVEIKSDISEIGRAYTSRKYYKVNIPRKLHPRHMTITQGRYFMEPWCMAYADRAYCGFMKETGLVDDIKGYSMHDLTYWEVRMGAWAVTSFASQEFFHEITIPYNNRNLLKMFLQFPEEDRINDLPHKALMIAGNNEMAKFQQSVKDSYFGKKRMALETVYYYYATLLNTLRG